MNLWYSRTTIADIINLYFYTAPQDPPQRPPQDRLCCPCRQ